MGSFVSKHVPVKEPPPEETPKKHRKASMNPCEAEGVVGLRNKLVRHNMCTDIWEIYAPGRVLGEGMTGCVMEVTKRSTYKVYLFFHIYMYNRYAMKQMKKNRFESGDINGLLNEIDLLKQLDHPNCIKLYETYEDKRKIYLIMEV